MNSDFLNIIKIGGNVINDPEKLDRFLRDFSEEKGKQILVHGGGRTATELAENLGHKVQLLDGRRITDEKTLEIALMTYAGKVNKTIVAGLQQYGCNALGLSGADLDIIRAHMRQKTPVDYGYVGDIDHVNVNALTWLLRSDITPVICALTHDGNGQILNTNADTIASSIAIALSKRFETSLVYTFEKPGVLEDISREDTVIPELDHKAYKKLKKKGKISEGMIPKLDNAFDALKQGLNRVVLGNASELPGLTARIHQKGTQLKWK